MPPLGGLSGGASLTGGSACRPGGGEEEEEEGGRYGRRQEQSEEENDGKHERRDGIRSRSEISFKLTTLDTMTADKCRPIYLLHAV